VEFIHLIPQEDVATIPAATVGTHTITGNITCNATKFFKKFVFRKGSGKTMEKAIGDLDGKYMEYGIEGFFAGNTPETRAILNGLLNGTFIAIATLADGTQLLYGDKVTGVNVETNEFGTEALGGTAARGFKFSLKGYGESMAYILDGTFPIS
jgi:hypothetical protein